MNLEEKIAKLDDLATEIENGAPLEESLKLFEQSVVIADDCMKILNDCNGRLVVLQEKVRKLTDEK